MFAEAITYYPCIYATNQLGAMTDESTNDMTYLAVVNHEEQYSIWPAERELPAGWEAAGKEGTKDECLDYIEEVWTDMRPKSLRDKMDGAAAS